MATRLILGILREIWQEVNPQGPGVEIVTTSIRITAGQLCRIEGLLTVDAPTGAPVFTAVPSVSASGHLVVAVENTAAGGNLGTWTLDVRLLPSSNQGSQGANPHSPGTTGYILVAGGAVNSSPPSLQAVAAENLLPGQPIYADHLGQWRLATALTYGKTLVAGLATAPTLIGFVAIAEFEMLTLSDWTSVVGVAALTPNQQYYLSTIAGQLTVIAPTGIGQTCVRVGHAVSTTTMEIAISPPILL